MTAELRAAIGAAAVKAAQAVGYVGAGTVEFIVDGAKGLRPDGYWFMEMNTRLQVEHPVTEAITGLDLVEWQFRVAAGEPLPLSQDQVPLNGHAVEARLYAEDPERGVLPSTGRLAALTFPAGVRVDTGVEAGSEISPYYDPMIAKLIAHAENRDLALDRLSLALDRTVVAGPHTNLALLTALCAAHQFREQRFDTSFIERHAAALGAAPQGLDRAAAAAGVQRLIAQEAARVACGVDRRPDEPASPWDAIDGFQLSGARSTVMSVLIDGAPVTAEVTHGSNGPTVAVDGAASARDAFVVEGTDAIYVLRGGRQTIVRRAEPGRALDHAEGDGVIRAPMHGKVLALLVTKGDKVAKGQRVAIIEAMKMEHALVAPHAGTVAEVAVTAGSQVAEGARVLAIEADA
jgi:3-methylcrotonyl-CoA carboxylase alpha subunit